MKRLVFLAAAVLVAVSVYAGVTSRLTYKQTSFSWASTVSANSEATSEAIQLASGAGQYNRWRLKVKFTLPVLPAALSTQLLDSIDYVTYGMFGKTRILYDSTRKALPGATDSIILYRPSTAVDSIFADDIYLTVRYADSAGDSAATGYTGLIETYFQANGQ